MRIIKFIIASIIAALAFILVIAEINVNVFAFFAIKLTCVATMLLCIRYALSLHVIDIDED